MEIISNISSIITCILFIFYIIGRIWKISITKKALYEQFKILPYTENLNNFEDNKVLIIDDFGEKFTISSPQGIRNIKIYAINYETNNKGECFVSTKKKIDELQNFNLHDTLYIQCSLGENIPTKQIEIERMDYIKVTFELGCSGKTGNILPNYTSQLTIKSLIYYLCS